MKKEKKEVGSAFDKALGKDSKYLCFYDIMGRFVIGYIPTAKSMLKTDCRKVLLVDLGILVQNILTWMGSLEREAN